MAAIGSHSQTAARCAAALDRFARGPDRRTLDPMRWLGVLLLGACGFHSHELAPFDSQGGPDTPGVHDAPADGRPDAPPDAPPDGALCYGAGILKPCLSAAPTAPLDVPVGTTAISTDSGCTQVIAQTGGPEVCLLAYTNITIEGTLEATGARPLALLATGSISISGEIDVGSYRVGNTPHAGAGEASDALCGAPGTPGADTAGAGGGAGGSFVGKGGDGAAGRLGAGGAGSTAVAAMGTPMVVRGGCPGGAGATGTGTGGGSGHGGGAVYLVAVGAIQISGEILACGGGGDGGQSAAGGGGAGAGGFIGLDAPTVQVSGILDALGGGGGEGGGMGGGANGNSGLTATSAALGGVYNTNGGDGGDGAFATPDAVSGHQGNSGGGGGGGGTGAIRVFPSQTLGGTVAPPVS